MSPTSADRSPLLAVDDSEGNILLQAAEPPPLELPEPLKSEGRRLDSEPEELRPPQLRRIDTDDGSAAGAPSSSVEDEEERMVHEPHRPTSFGSEILATSEKLQSQQQQQQQEEQEPSQPQSQTPTVPRSSPVAVPGMSWDCAAATGHGCRRRGWRCPASVVGTCVQSTGPAVPGRDVRRGRAGQQQWLRR